MVEIKHFFSHQCPEDLLGFYWSENSDFFEFDDFVGIVMLIQEFPILLISY